MALSISSKGHTRAPGSWFSVFVTLEGVDDLDTKVSFDVWVEDDVGKMLVEDGDVTLVVVDVADGGDKRWQDFSSSVVVMVVAVVVVVEVGAEECWKCFWDWQEFSTATDRKLQSLVGMMILLVDVLEWADLFLVKGSLIFLFVVILVDVLFEVVVAVAVAVAATTPSSPAPPAVAPATPPALGTSPSAASAAAAAAAAAPAAAPAALIVCDAQADC